MRVPHRRMLSGAVIQPIRHRLEEDRLVAGAYFRLPEGYAFGG